MTSKKKTTQPQASLDPLPEMEVVRRHNLSGNTLSDKAHQIQFIQETPGTWSVKSTDQLRPEFKHESVRNRHFYTLPIWLCEELESEEFSGKVDQEQIAVEKELSHWAAEENFIAVHNGHLFSDPYRDIDSPVSFRSQESAPDEQSNQATPNAAALDNAARIRNETVKRPFVQALRGYQGWLMSNPQFLQELDRLLLDHGPEIEDNHFDAQAWHVRLQADWIMNQNPGSVELPQALARYQVFLSRWRLSRLAGPSYPIPLGPLASGLIPQSMFHQLQSSGGFFFLPDIIPIPSRDELRSLITGALSAEEDTPHLAKWRSLMDSSKSKGPAIQQHKRRFQVQHCWRLLHERHPGIFSRKRNKLQQLFAGALETSVNSIKEDFREFNRTLGDHWEERGFQLPSNVSGSTPSANSPGADN
ncbi:hypothetical protein [Bremerella sp.]|uniref:hypothetical protein n=1 Tax=Bremerella sp. TaxID=2795602 RepID=UPI00391D7506